jgi:hypothetical protein
MNNTCKFAGAGLMAVGLTAFGLVGGTAAQAAGLAPVGQDDYYTVPQGGTLTIPAPGVLANDTDAEGDSLYVGNDFGYTGADSVTVNQDGSFTFTPNPLFYGVAGFAYYPSDGAFGNETAVHITVTPTVPAPPVPLVANADNYSTTKDTVLTVPAASGLFANDTGPAFLYKLNGPANELVIDANGGFVFTPAPGFVGTRTFGYATSNGTSQSNDALITIQVTDPAAPPAVAPATSPDAYSTVQDTALTVPVGTGLLANDSFPAGSIVDIDDLSGEVVTQLDGGFVYTPAAGFVGTKEFSYRMTDGTTPSAWTKVQIVVTAAPVNPPAVVPPVANPDAYSTAQDVALTVPAGSGLLANDSFPTGAVIDIDDLSGEVVAQFDGSFVYTPAAGFVGTKEFAYRMSDGSALSDWASVTITVAAPAAPATPGAPDTSAGEGLPTLAYTGSGPASLAPLGAAGSLFGLGAAGLWIARRRRATS